MAKVVIYQEDGSYIEREPTAVEIEQEQTDYAEWQRIQQAKAQAEAKRQAALAKLAALGLEEDDLKALGL